MGESHRSHMVRTRANMPRAAPARPPAPSYAPPFRQRTEVSNWRLAVSKETETQRLGPLPMQRTGHLTKAKDSKSSGQQSAIPSRYGRGTDGWPLADR